MITSLRRFLGRARLATSRGGLVVLGALVAFIALTACDHSEKASPGLLKVSWQIQGNTCKAAGVETVRVTLLLDGAVYEARDSACAAGEMTFVDMPSMVYGVQLTGFDVDGETRYTGELEAIDLVAGETNETGRIAMTKVGSGISLAWYFANNLLCSFNGVVEVEVTVWYDQLQLHNQIYSCDPFGDTETGAGVPSGDLGVKVYDLQVPEVDVVLFGLDANGDRIFVGEERAIQLDEGAVKRVNVKLEACDGACG